jgi:hypothetical protein
VIDSPFQMSAEMIGEIAHVGALSRASREVDLLRYRGVDAQALNSALRRERAARDALAAYRYAVMRKQRERSGSTQLRAL